MSEEISRYFIDTGAFSDLETPTILTSGELGIYYVNTEKLLLDDGVWENYGSDSKQMYDHAVRVAQRNPRFNCVIDELTEMVAGNLLAHSFNSTKFAIAGGQSRDWPFSGPVAQKLHLPHVSLYKEVAGDGSVEIIDASGGVSRVDDLSDYRVIVVPDLITKASSIYRVVGDEVKGWVPQLETLHADATDIFAVVSRQQGGEEHLARHGIQAHSLLQIDSDFLGEHSQYPKRALAYKADPRKWADEYVAEHGAIEFLGFFDPAGTKFSRADKFLSLYNDVLDRNGHLGPFFDAYLKRFVP